MKIKRLRSQRLRHPQFFQEKKSRNWTHKSTSFIVLAATASFILIPAIPFSYSQSDSPSQVSAASGDNAVYAGMPKNELFKIYNTGHIKKYEKKDNREALVFDDVSTQNPDDTITFYLVDGKVNAWDKNRVAFPTDEPPRKAIYAGMLKKDLFNIYATGNLKEYERKDNGEVLVFDDILSSDSNDTITFHLIDGKVSSWDTNAVALTPEARLKAIEERSKYAVPSLDYPVDDSDMKNKEQNRSSSIRQHEYDWYYNRGLYYW